MGASGGTTASVEVAEELGALLARIQPDDLTGAIATVRAQLRRTGDPELRLLYGELALAACDFPAACRQLEAAVVEFRARGLRRRAAVAARYLARVHTEGWGNRVVGLAWLRRARGLLAGEPPCVEQGWVAVALIGCDVPDAEELKASADLALELARRFGDVRLEVRALAEAGLAMVSAGAVEAGMTQLDEAMTAAIDGEVDPLVTLLAGCCMVTACERAGDLVRAEAWLGGPERMGLTGPALHLTVAHCAATVGTLLREVGRWEEAERVLTTALDAV